MHFLWLASLAHLAVASPVALPNPSRRTVAQLDQAAFEEAQQPDTSATKAFAGTLIKVGLFMLYGNVNQVAPLTNRVGQTADDRCLFVDELSGDFRANLTPIQVAECGSTDGQEWDIITNGKHNNAVDSMLIVSTLVRCKQPPVLEMMPNKCPDKCLFQLRPKAAGWEPSYSIQLRWASRWWR